MTNIFKKKKEVIGSTHTLIYHHLGLGDYIILSGGLKYLKRNNLIGPTFIICKHQYLSSIKQLYDDVDDFEIIAVNNWKQADLLANHWNGENFFIGFDKLQDWKHFDKDFYRIINVDFQERWNSFSIKRNIKAEEKLIYSIKPPEKFAFVHDDISRGYKINNEDISEGLEFVMPDFTERIF